MSEQLRRRALGAPAARSLLLTLLGEYVLARPEGVWQETLVGALGALGYSEHAARQALARSAREGWLDSARRGRRTRITLTPPTRALLASGAERIYSFGQPHGWDGRWLLVVLRVSERNRAVRHQLRSRLAWAGFGSLGGGLWLTPHVARELEVKEALRQEPLAEGTSFISEFGEIGNPRELVQTAWDLAHVQAQYEAFSVRFARVRPVSPAACFRELTLMVHAWRKFPFLDPDLPEALLPARWPRERAHLLFADRHERWAAPARGFFAGLEESVAPVVRRAA
jgi:phenylacetic acid degradation operon negative regulatory protein